MSEVRTNAGSSISVSAGLPATEDQAGYEALTFTAIGEVTNLGDIGRTYNEVTHNPLAQRRTEFLRGSYENGNLTLEMADVTDAGQALLVANSEDTTDPNYSFKITDKSGDVYYFQGMVMANPKTFGTSDDVIMSNATVRVNSDIVEVLI